jgi:hypothetical protein
MEAVPDGERTAAAGADAALGDANGGAGAAVMANGHAPTSDGRPKANGHAPVLQRESIIRTRTGQALEQELADARAPFLP